MRSRASGFTLVELLVALVVAGVAVAIGYAGLAQLSDAAARSQASSRSVISSAGVRSELRRWLSSATLMDGTQTFRGVHRTNGPIRADELTTAVSTGGSLRRGPHRFRLWLDVDPLTTQEGAVVELMPIGDGGPRPPDTLELSPSARGLALRYLVTVDGRERWVDEWTSQSQLPHAVELRLLEVEAATLGAADDRQRLPPLLAMPVTLPIGLERE
jgi:prepilin-type N-terminal cleavage/methylation domain-containing protein